MWRRRSRCRWKATTWWWICNRHSGARVSANPESRESGAGPSDHPEMTTWAWLSVPHLLPLPRIAHQRDVAIDAVHELAVGHGDEQGKHHAEMQRQQRPHRGRIAP